MNHGKLSDIFATIQDLELAIIIGAPVPGTRGAHGFLYLLVFA